MITYNKLVRDKIPHIIEVSGKQCEVRMLNDIEYEVALKTKMQEELNEFLEAEDVNEQMKELTDLLEVIYSFARSKGVSDEQLEETRQEKFAERGGFDDRLFLVSVSTSDQ